VARQLKVHHVVLEMDCLAALHMIQARNLAPSFCQSLVREIKVFLKKNDGMIYVHHAPADFMAKLDLQGGASDFSTS